MLAHILKNAATLDPIGFTDWGDVSKPIGEPVSHQSGLIMFQNDDKSSEMGLWLCTPGSWRCEVSKDEFFYVLAGRAVYTEDGGRVTEITAGMTCAFPAGWKGDCTVIETIRKVYMVR
jgi:hypothetical protein